MQRLHGRGCEWPEEIEEVRRWYQPHLDQHYEDAVVRAGDLDQLQRIAAGYPSVPFLTDFTLDPPSATSDEAGPPLRDEDYLILRPSTRPRARSGGRCSCSMSSMAASRPI